MVHVKGSALLHRISFLDKKATLQQKQTVLSRLEPTLQSVIRHGIIPAGWYPYEYLPSLLIHIDEVVGKGDLGLVSEIGHFSGVQAVTGIYKMFIKFGSPEFVIGKSVQVWRQLFDSGTMSSSLDAPHTARMILIDFALPSKVLSLSLQGWVQSVIEMSGAKNVKTVVTKWPSLEDNRLEITTRWE